MIKKEVGIPGETYSDYKPHVTVGYMKKGTPLDKYKALEKLLAGKEFAVDKVRLNIGEDKYYE